MTIPACQQILAQFLDSVSWKKGHFKINPISELLLVHTVWTKARSCTAEDRFFTVYFLIKYPFFWFSGGTFKNSNYNFLFQEQLTLIFLFIFTIVCWSADLLAAETKFTQLLTHRCWSWQPRSTNKTSHFLSTLPPPLFEVLLTGRFKPNRNVCENYLGMSWRKGILYK